MVPLTCFFSGQSKILVNIDMLHLALASMALQYSGLADEGDAVQPAFIGHEDDIQSFFFDEEDDVLSDTDYELPKAQERMLSLSLCFFRLYYLHNKNVPMASFESPTLRTDPKRSIWYLKNPRLQTFSMIGSFQCLFIDELFNCN